MLLIPRIVVKNNIRMSFLVKKLKWFYNYILREISRIPIVYLNRQNNNIMEIRARKINRILIVAQHPSTSLLESSIKNIFNKFGYHSEIFPVNKKKHLELNSFSLQTKSPAYSQIDFGHWLLDRRLLKKIKKEKFDLVFILESNWVLLPHTIIDIKRRTNAMVILWETNIHIWKNFQAACLPLYDIVFSMDSYMIPVLKTAGVKNVRYWPVGVDNELMYMPATNIEERNKYSYDLGFLGALTAERIDLFENLADFDLKIYGSIMDYAISKKLKSKIQKDWLDTEEKRKFYNLTKIIICPENVHTHISSPSIRLFEVALCGGFPLVEYRKDIDDMFDVGTELICYYNKEDLINKINYYLSNSDERNAVSEKCRKKVLQNHTFTIRISQLIRNIDDIYAIGRSKMNIKRKNII